MNNLNDLAESQALALLVRLLFLGAFSYVSVKYLADVLDPTKNQKKDAQRRAQILFDKLNMSNMRLKLNEYELMVASQLIDPGSIDVSWKDIGGLAAVINDIKGQVILPMKMPGIINNSRHYRPPTGVLLHGPPGCGKTMLAKATAREAGARFINLEVAMLTDKWYGESQKLAKAVFTLAKKIQPCIIFIDEIDTFLRSRDSQDHEATAMVKAQFMTLWDGLETEGDCRVIIMGATNRPRDVDRAILRRMPAMYSIGLPETDQRREILKALNEPDTVDPDVNLDTIAELTDGFSGSDLREMYRTAAMLRVNEYVNDHPELFDSHNPNMHNSTNLVRQITMEDFVTVVTEMRSRGL